MDDGLFKYELSRVAAPPPVRSVYREPTADAPYQITFRKKTSLGGGYGSYENLINRVQTRAKTDVWRAREF